MSRRDRETCALTCGCPFNDMCPTGETKALDAYERVNEGEPAGWEP